jgi:RecA-family ATPase
VTLTPEIERYGDYIAGLPQAERAAAKQALKQYVVAQMDPEEFGEAYRVSTLGEYLDNEIELPPMLVEPGLVARGALSTMTSRAGKGKTAVSLNCLVRWSMGKPLFDELDDVLAPVGPLRILVIENEGAPGHFQKILKLILHKNGFAKDEIELARENMHIWGDGGWSGLKLDHDDNVELISTAAAKTKADILFIEPFRGLWSGDENSSTDMAVVLDSMSQIASENQCGVMLTHHETKSGGGEEAMDAARGSTAFEGHAAVMARWSQVRGGRQSEMSWVKWRYDEKPAPVRMEFERETWSYRLVEENELERDILKLLGQFPGDYFTLAEIREELNMQTKEDQSLRRACRNLIEQDRLRERRAENAAQWTIKTTDDAGDSLAVV